MRELLRKPKQILKATSIGLASSWTLRHQINTNTQPIARNVSPLTGPQLQRKCGCGGAVHSGSECTGCKKKKQKLQGKTVESGAPQTAPPIVHEVLSSSGQPLSADARSFMEPRFGHDFSRVRVHTGARADHSAQAVNATAYTVGHHIVFGSGQYAPMTDAGKKTLAHELTHVVQQGELGIPGQLAIGRADNAHEHEAEMAAQGGLGTTSVHHAASGISLQRQAAAAVDAVPLCTESPPPPTCTICLLPPGGVTWAKGIAGPYVVIGGAPAGTATGAQTEDLANKYLKADPDCFPRRIGPTSGPPKEKPKKWWQIWK